MQFLSKYVVKRKRNSRRYRYIVVVTSFLENGDSLPSARFAKGDVEVFEDNAALVITAFTDIGCPFGASCALLFLTLSLSLSFFLSSA